MELGEPLKLSNGASRSDLADLLARIEAATNAVMLVHNDQQTLQNTRDRLRIPAHELAKQARISLKGQAGNTDAIGALPRLPSATTNPATYLPVLEDIAQVWERINRLPAASVPAATLPLTIPLTENGEIVQKSLADFRAAIAALRATVDALAANAQTDKQQRAIRDELHQSARALLGLYPAAVKSRLPAGHALLKNLPKR